MGHSYPFGNLSSPGDVERCNPSLGYKKRLSCFNQETVQRRRAMVPEKQNKMSGLTAQTFPKSIRLYIFIALFSFFVPSPSFLSTPLLPLDKCKHLQMSKAET